jgi:DNA-binding response OmpR family regulator
MHEKTRVLIIDGDTDFLRSTREGLDKVFEVATATDAEAGLERAEREAPGAIVLGYLEPRGASFELHRRLRSDPTTKDIPLVIVDVRPEEHARKGWRRHEGLQMVAEDYTSRPVRPAELIEAIERVVRRASGEPMGLWEASEHMEKTLERINRIEELLVG